MLKKAILGTGTLALAGAIETAYFYRRTMIRQNAKLERTMKMAGTDWSQYGELLAKRKEYMMSQPHEEVYQTAFDGLKLHAAFFPAIKEDVSAKPRVVICFHGYTSQGLADFTGLTDYYFRKGFGMLHPDARAHGKSEGKYIGFGCLDRKDACMWIQWIIERYAGEVDIYLHGISMGGATVLMASGSVLPPQVKGIISDCGFTSPKEVFTHVLHTMYHLPTFPVIPAASLLNKKLAGYGMDDCNAKREVAKATIPILFIHGSKDTFVPVSMCHELYDSCGAKKKIMIVEGAAHGESYYKNMEAYEKALHEFIEETS